MLASANLKVASVASDVLGVSGRAMREARGGGEADPQVLAALARGRLRAKLPALRRALVGRVKPPHLLLIAQILAHSAFSDPAIARLHEESERPVPPCEEALTLLQTLPGRKEVAAAAIVAEGGPDMTRFPSAKHLASWAGVCPGHTQRGGKRLSGKTTKGNVWLRAIVGAGAWAAARTHGRYVSAQYHRRARRRGTDKAIMAVAHSILVCIYYVLRDKRPYPDRGADYFEHLAAARLERYHVQRLDQLGFTVTLTPQAA